MFRTLMKESLSLLICLLAAIVLNAEERPKIITPVTLNGVLTNAYFNDGDTFKILDGSHKNTRVRIAGFNTLETYGPVHQWMDNHADYLFDLANDATEKAQEGSWVCESDGKKDTYGRLLAVCDDLAHALIGAGLAHAYSIDSSPADRQYLASQQAAKSKHLGIWQFGIPNYIIASIHSADEGVADIYNRLISTVDGHTKKWFHQENYRSCQKVCVSGEASCMVYVPFDQRYGRQRPECLRQQ